jgi:hypothetical protein
MELIDGSKQSHVGLTWCGFASGRCIDRERKKKKHCASGGPRHGMNKTLINADRQHGLAAAVGAVPRAPTLHK